jgi:TPR repeat protein
LSLGKKERKKFGMPRRLPHFTISQSALIGLAFSATYENSRVPGEHVKATWDCSKCVSAILPLVVGLGALLAVPVSLKAQTPAKPAAKQPLDVYGSIKHRAEAGDARAEAELGAMYQKGIGVQQDYAEALAWDSKSANQGIALGEKSLADLYFDGLGVPRDYTQAFAWYQKAADQGDAAAEEAVGRFHLYGIGMAIDFSQARALFLKAEAQGNGDADYDLGAAYEFGISGKKDMAEAIAWYQKGAALGSAIAEDKLGEKYMSGIGVQRDYAQALAWFQKAAAQGNADAEFNLSAIYAMGNGVPKDYAQGLAWAQKAADQDDGNGEYAVGSYYLLGLGIPKDNAQALAWFQKSVRHGNADAEYVLGNLYLDGLGVPKDYAQALAWYQKSARQSNPAAQDGLGTLYQNGWGVPKDYAQAFAWFQKAAQQGNTRGEVNVGRSYQNGLGVPKDNARAMGWYQKAAAQGDPMAKQDLAALQQQVLGELQSQSAKGTATPSEASAGAQPAPAQVKYLQSSPIFSQIVAFSTPTTFLGADEKTQPIPDHPSKHFYIRESVLRGETVDRWSQMISVTGVEGGASIPSMSATKAVEMIASGYSKTCPDTYNAVALGSFDVDAYHAFAGIVSCGTNLKLATAQSESTLIIGIVGERDLYTIQWGVRGAPSTGKLPLDKSEWDTRLQQLQPIKLCPIVQGEHPLDPSCSSTPAPTAPGAGRPTSSPSSSTSGNGATSDRQGQTYGPLTFNGEGADFYVAQDGNLVPASVVDGTIVIHLHRRSFQIGYNGEQMNVCLAQSPFPEVQADPRGYKASCLSGPLSGARDPNSDALLVYGGHKWNDGNTELSDATSMKASPMKGFRFAYQISELMFVEARDITLDRFSGTLYGYIIVYKQHERSNKDIMPIQLILE